jgi:O-succinylbenzoic acid--CoA ligase
MMIVRSLVVGMDLVVRPPASNPLKGLSIPIDFAALVPLQLSTLLAEEPAALDRISTIIVGGAPVSHAVIEKLKGRKCKVFATYGMTETLTHIALQRLNGEDAQDAFHLLPGIAGSSVADGCLVVTASHLGPAIVTRDMIEWVTPSSFRVLGRADEAINSGGVKVYPHRVESALNNVMKELTIEARFFVAGQPDDRLGERVCLIIEGSPLTESKTKALQAALSGRLSAYERPREIIFQRAFLETPTQKVDRRGTLASLK